MEFKRVANKIKEYQGDYKNPEDIWDLTTWENVKREIDNFPPKTRVYLDPEKTDYEKLDTVKEFLNDLSEELKEVFLEELEYRVGKNQALSPKIVEYLIKNDIIFPRLTILTGSYAVSLLNRLGFEPDILDGEFLFVFNFPLPVAKFWWKKLDILGLDTEVTFSVSWGEIYEALLNTFWYVLNSYWYSDKLLFHRINQIGEHRDGFYYLFYIS